MVKSFINNDDVSAHIPDKIFKVQSKPPMLLSMCGALGKNLF